MPSRQSNLKKPASSLPLSLIVLLSVAITSCQDLPTDVTETQAQLSVSGNASAAPADAFVDGDATGADDGSSWADAYTDLQDALENTTDDNDDGAISIWIADGTYKPTAVYSPGGVEGGAYGAEAQTGGAGFPTGIPLAQYEADRDAGCVVLFARSSCTP